MPKASKLLFVIFDGEHARFVRANPNNTLHTERSIESIYRGEHGASVGMRRGIEPRPDDLRGGPAHQVEKDQFARMVLEEAKTAIYEDERLIVVAPTHYLNAIDGRLQNRIAGKLAKNLVNTPDHQLNQHLREWVGLPKRGAV